MKKKFTGYMLIGAAIMTMVMNTSYSFAQTIEQNIELQQNNQVQSKKLMLLPEAKDAKINVGEKLDHKYLSRYVKYRDGNDVTDAELVPLYEKGEHFFENGVAITEGRARIQIGLKDLATEKVEETNLYFNVCIIDDGRTEEVVPHMPYIYGYEDGTFRPQRYVTREELASMISRLLLGGAKPIYEADFTDLSANRYSNNNIGHLSEIGIMEGYEDGTYRPQQPVSHDEMNTIIIRTLAYMGKTGPSTMNSVYKGEEALLTRTEAVIVLNHVFERMCEDVAISNPYPDLTSEMLGYKDILHASILHKHIVFK